MNIILDLSGKPKRLIFEGISHNERLSIIDDRLTKFNKIVANDTRKLKYTIQHYALHIIGETEILRVFCQMQNWEPSVKYSFPLMPANVDYAIFKRP